MIRRVVILVLLAVAPLVGAMAQALSESYYRENPQWIDAELWAREGEYQAMPQTTSAPFEQFARWGFSFVGYSFRGEEELSLTTRLGAIELDSPLERYADYSLLNLLRRAPTLRTNLWSNAHSEWGAEPRSELFDLSTKHLRKGHTLRSQLSSRTYLWGTYFSSVGQLDSLWNYSLMVGGRWGRDGNIAGLFTEEENIYLSAERIWGEMVERRLQVAFMLSPTLRSQRSWNTEEVFSLAGNKHYNSYWGWQNGKVRSSRVKRECVPTLYGSFDIDDNILLANINISTLLRAGRKSGSSLDWTSAPNPLPDYYGYLPSGASDEQVAGLAKEAWLRGEERFTQIDWQGLYTANSLSSSGVHYALFEEREDITSAVVDASAAFVGIEGMRLGVRLSHHTSHNYNTPSDLLGGDALAEGFRRYDYSIGHSEWGIYYTQSSVRSWGEVSLGARMGGVGLEYRSPSRGRTRKAEELVARLAARWSKQMGERVVLGATARYSCEPTYWEDRFGASEGAMTPNPYAHNSHNTSAEVWGRVAVGDVSLHTTLFARYNGGGSRIEHFWNDLGDCYATLLAGNLNSLTMGAELSVEVPIAKSLQATIHTSLLSSRYTTDGIADVVSFEGGSTLAEGLPIRLAGRVATSSPLAQAAVVMRYFAPWGWTLGAEWSVVASRYMEPSLWLCSEEVLGRNLSPEVREAITSPQSLGNANSLNLFAYRKWGATTLSLSLANLLNYTNAYYDGYQPSRLRVRESEYAIDYQPHDPKFQYVYPRYIIISVSYAF